VAQLETVQAASKRNVFTTIAILPSFMLVCYLGMLLWFRSKGGYKPVDLSHSH
jgi:MFS transporter, DHA2 family, metal-tetracycline-proton antiporter